MWVWNHGVRGYGIMGYVEMESFNMWVWNHGVCGYGLLITGDAVTSRKGRKATLKIVHRFHFSSSLKRMSVISAFVPATSSSHTHLVTVKGAPEVLKEMVRVSSKTVYVFARKRLT